MYSLGRKKLLLLSIFTVIVSGCGMADRQVASANPMADEPYLVFRDDEGREVKLLSKPERIVVLSPEMLEMLYEIGGTAIATVETVGIQLPDAAKKLEKVGQINQVSGERVLALQPDFIIGQSNFHQELATLFEASGVPTALMKLGSIPDIHDKALLLGKIVDQEEKAAAKLVELEERVNAIQGRLPDESRTFVNLNITPGAISIQRSGMSGIEIAKTMNLLNVAEQIESNDHTASTIPYSLEKLVEHDPDYVFLIIHGSKEAGEAKIVSELESNPAWAALTAVREQRVMIMPSELFLVNPGLKLDEAMTYLGRYLYPDLFPQP